MTSTTTITLTLTDEERYAAVWALVDDLSRMAGMLEQECLNFTNAQRGDEMVRAEDVAGVARQISTTAGPLAALLGLDRPEVI